jgi:hypothetical protein
MEEILGVVAVAGEIIVDKVLYHHLRTIVGK